MKPVIIFLLLSEILISCGSKKEKITEKLSEKGKTEKLTSEQIHLAGIKTAMPEMRELSLSINATGEISVPPQNIAKIHSPLNGIVQKIYFFSGEQIKKGQALCSIQNTDFNNTQKEFLSSIAQLRLARLNFERKKILFEADATSKKEYEIAKTDYELAQVSYKALKNELETLGFNAAALEKGQTIQTSLRIRSPINGLVSKSNINKGQNISPSDQLFEVIQPSHPYLSLKVFPKDAPYVYPGQKIYFNLPENDEEYEAKIHLVNRSVEENSNAITVHADLDKRLDDVLYIGRYVTAKIISRPKRAYALPKEAIFKENDKTMAFVKKSNQYVEKEIQTGIENENFVEIKNYDGKEEFVIKGAYYLQSMPKAEE